MLYKQMSYSNIRINFTKVHTYSEGRMKIPSLISLNFDNFRRLLNAASDTEPKPNDDITGPGHWRFKYYTDFEGLKDFLILRA